MNPRVLGVYREIEFSPGKADDDAAILDAVLAELQNYGVETVAADAARFSSDDAAAGAHMVLAMCQGEGALSRLAAVEEAGAVAVNSALAIRNCYRDLLCAGLARAGVPTPDGVTVNTLAPFDLKPLRVLDLSAPVYVKRGDMHALGSDDVQRVEGPEELEATLSGFARRGIGLAYVQQEVAGPIVKFYGVSGGEYFTAIANEGDLDERLRLALVHAASVAAGALGLEIWGGDAVITGERFSIIDFNDWPSFSRVRTEAAHAIARRAMLLLRRHPVARHLNT